MAAHSLHVHLGWMVNAYGLGEALANLVQPFMLPILGVLGNSRALIMGYTFVVCLALTPVVIGFLMLLWQATLPYPPQPTYRKTNHRGTEDTDALVSAACAPVSVPWCLCV